LNDDVLAVIVVVPAPTAVASPVAAPMVATEGTLEVQVTELVMFWVEEFFELPKVPIAVNCAV
jgi:hypothetical protein